MHAILLLCVIHLSDRLHTNATVSLYITAWVTSAATETCFSASLQCYRPQRSRWATLEMKRSPRKTSLTPPLVMARGSRLGGKRQKVTTGYLMKPSSEVYSAVYSSQTHISDWQTGQERQHWPWPPCQQRCRKIRGRSDVDRMLVMYLKEPQSKQARWSCAEWPQVGYVLT